eukprot:SAG11_NODE_52862_length_105_cov_61.000000_1_plen_29_part_01
MSAVPKIITINIKANHICASRTKLNPIGW